MSNIVTDDMTRWEYAQAVLDKYNLNMRVVEIIIDQDQEEVYVETSEGKRITMKGKDFIEISNLDK